MTLFNRILCTLLFIVSFVALGVAKEAKTENELFLLKAVLENRMSDIEEGLKTRKVSPNITDEYGLSLLIHAVSNQNKEAVELLCKHGAKVRYRIKTEANNGDGKNRMKMLFLQNKAALDFAITKHNLELVMFLVDKGAELNPKEETLSPLATATEENDYIMLYYLFKRGAKIPQKSAASIIRYAVTMNSTKTNLNNLKSNVNGYSNRNRKEDPPLLDMRVIQFWDQYGVEISEDNLIDAQTRRRTYMSSTFLDIKKLISRYDKWKEDPQNDADSDIDFDKIVEQQKEKVQKQKEKEQLLAGSSNIEEKKIDSLINQANERSLQQVELQSDKVTETQKLNLKPVGFVFVTIFVFIVVLIVYIKYGSIEWNVWVGLIKKLVGYQTSSTNTQHTVPPPNPTNHRNTTTPPPNPLRKKTPPSSPPKKKKNSIQEVRGWDKDDTVGISVQYLTIEDRINHIRLCKEHEKAIRRMMWYMRRLEEYPDDKIEQVLGASGLLPSLQNLWDKIDPSLLRSVYKRSLYLLVENYALRDPKVLPFLNTMAETKPKNAKKSTSRSQRRKKKESK